MDKGQYEFHKKCTKVGTMHSVCVRVHLHTHVFISCVDSFFLFILGLWEQFVWSQFFFFFFTQKVGVGKFGVRHLGFGILP